MGRLYIVGTPIGNRQDLTPRATEILRAVSAVACEDTRVTQKLLSPLGVTAPRISLHHHSPDAAIDRVLDHAIHGDVAFVSDAGTPAVSDPGGKLVARAHQRGIEVVAIPGPSAVTAALSVAGFPAERFRFLGFLPHKHGRQTMVQSIGEMAETVVLFEAPTRLLKLLTQLDPIIGDRPVVVARELTKIHETVRRGIAAALAEYYSHHPQELRGEVVVVIGPKS
jgi:16S rRNA (cytidine1402-2'-O)-methyltransferase